MAWSSTRALDVIDADIVAKHGAGVGVPQFDGCPGEADEGGLGQGIAHVAGEPVDEVVLAAVRLVGDDHDVAALGKRRAGVALLLGEELLNGGEHHAAHVDRELDAQIRPTCRLYRRLAQQVLTAGEGAEKLVVEVVSVGENHDGRVGHGRFADDAPGIEGHTQALTRSLGVPYDADPPVARRASGLPAGLVAASLLGNPFHRVLRLQLSRAQGLSDCRLNRMELVVAGHLLNGRLASVIIKHDKIADQGQKPAGCTDAFEHYLQLGHLWICQGLAGDRAPGLEPFPSSGECADAGLGAVGDDEHLVHGKQRRQLGLVGLELLPRCPDGGVLVRRALQFDHPERQAIDEQHDIGPAVVLVLGDGELVDCQPVVVGGVVEIDNLRLRAPDSPFVGPVLHRHAVCGHAVESAVAGLQCRPFRAGQPAEDIVQGLKREGRG